MKQFYQLTFAFIITIFSFSGNVQATHISGGDITYECVGQDSFLVTLKLFRDCAGVGLATGTTINGVSGCGGSIVVNLALQTSAEVSALCPTQISNSTCNGGTYPGIQEFIYTGIAVLSPACNSWTLSWSSCCRNAQVTNLVNPSVLGTYLYTTLSSGSFSCNSSPVFNAQPVPYVCKNQVANINLGAFDPDGDSLVYYLTPGQVSATTLVTYATGYSYLQAFGGTSMSLNSSTGQLTFTPSGLGIYLVAVKIQEYDRLTGIQKGTITRDFQVVSFNCATNVAPVVSAGGFYNAINNSKVDSNHIGVCVGDSFSFDIAISDANSTQTVSIVHSVNQTFGSNASATVTGGNPAVLHVSGLATISLAGRNTLYVRGNDGACPIPANISAAFYVDVNLATYAGVDQGICAGSQWASLSGVGGNTFVWSVISGSPIDTVSTSPNYNMSCKTCYDPIVSPQSTTTYQLLSNTVGSCPITDTVVVTVGPDFVLSVPLNDTICTTNSLVLTSFVSQPTLNYTYKWNHANSLNFDTILSPTATPSVGTNYMLRATAGVCVKTKSVYIDVTSTIPNSNSISGDTLVCSGEQANMQAHSGNVFSGYCATDVNTYDGLKGYATVGNLNTSSNDSFLPFSQFFGGNKYQMIYTKAELLAAGAKKGPIYSISMKVQTISNVSFQNVEVKMGCTANSNLSTGWVNNLETVLPASTQNPVAGWNKLSFTSPYIWDGTSNLVVQICYQTSTIGIGASVFRSFKVFGARYANTICSNNNVGIATNFRLDLKFEYYTGPNLNNLRYSWTPTTGMTNSFVANPSVTVNSPTTYTLVIQDLAGACSDTITHFVDAVTTFDAGFTDNGPYCLNDSADILRPIVAGGIFTGSGVSSTGLFTPSLAGVGTWPINYNISSPVACANDTTINIQVLGLLNASFTAKEFCVNSSADTLTSFTSGGIWSGTGISDTLHGIFNPTGLPAGDYPVTYSVSGVCTNSYTGIVRIIEPYTFTFNSNSKSVCQNTSINLASNYTLSSNPSQGSGLITEVWSDANGYISANGVFDATGVVPGNYTVHLSISAMDGNCGSTQSMTVVVKAIDYAFLLESEFCSSSKDSKLFVNPWLFGQGITYTQKPLSPLGVNDTIVIAPYGQNGRFDPSIRGAGQWEFELTYTNSAGCAGTTLDTIYVLDAPVSTVTSDGRTLTSNAEGPYTFQWFDCANNSPIAGETNRDFVSVQKGSYKVKVNVASCITTSECIETWPVGINEVESPFDVSVYPNPTENELNVDMGKNSYLDIEILDNTGKLVIRKTTNSQITTIDLGKLASGVYLVKMKGENGEQTKKIIKK
tara:strand:+ start:86223 stop:90191 length:3969 start_codon:yes stop_codon:yes gene_type:complete